MNPKEFCHKMGFRLEVEEIEHNSCVVHVIDSGYRIFESGKREGAKKVRIKHLKEHLRKGYDALMDMILEKLFN